MSASHTYNRTAYSILLSISLVHLLNDSIQAVIPAIFPILHGTLHLSYTQIGWIAFTLNVTASMLQPLIGLYTDARPKPGLLPIGVLFSLLGMVVLAFAVNFWQVLAAVTLIGIGSSVFHPESSRVAYLAAGPRRGLAQSIFQTGGNIGQALAPIFTALIFVPIGQFGIIWFTIAAVAAFVVQTYVARWYRRFLQQASTRKRQANTGGNTLPTRTIGYSIAILIMLLFSKFVYLASMTGFYAFYLMDTFRMSTERAQYFIFLLLIAGAFGTFAGGPLADLLGRRNMIWFSILGPAPFALLLPYANLFWSGVLLFAIGFILLSGFSVIIVYAQELMPGKVGTVSGLFFGLAFGLGGLGSVIVGTLADHTSIAFVIQACAYLPLIGLLAAFLPKDAILRGEVPEASVQ